MVAIGVRVEDPKSNTKFERSFPRLPVRIGRSPLNDLQLDFPFVSGFHAVLEEHEGRVMLRDLGSTNGTRLKSGRLQPNQVVDLAEHRNQFAILPVLLTTFAIEGGLTTAPQAPKAPLRAATTMFQQAVHVAGLRSPSPTEDFKPKLDALSEAVAASRDANHTLMKQLERSLKEVSDDARGPFAEQIARRFPDLTQRSDGRALLGRYASNSLLPASSPELVVEAVKEIAVQLLPELGAPQTPEQVATFLTQVNEALRVFLECFLQLREGGRQLEAEFGIHEGRRAVLREGINGAEDAAQLATELFNWKTQKFEAARELELGFTDMMIQQFAMVNGVKHGAKSVVEELSPGAIEREAQNPRHAVGGWLFGRYRKLWSLYGKRHADLAEEQHLFRVLFGSAFAQGFTDVRDRPSTTDGHDPSDPD